MSATPSPPSPGRPLAVIWGGTGQAKVVRPMIEAAGYQVAVVCDQDAQLASPFAGVPMLHDPSQLAGWLAGRDIAAIGFVVAIGGSLGRDRLALSQRLCALGLRPLTLVHERAWLAESARVGQGCQIAAMACVGVDVELGEHCIINTGAIVDHESHLAAGVHVMPGATLTGCVEVGCAATIGSHATVLPRIKIGHDAVVGAGAVVTRDVAPGTVVVGVPARLQT